MAHGNIYPPEKIDAALGNYFREGNLGALRELALLWMADRVDESLQDYMQDHGIEGPWETRERILVGVVRSPEDEQLIRRAARMAARRGGELVAVHVHPRGRPAEDRRDRRRPAKLVETARRDVPRGGRRGACRRRCSTSPGPRTSPRSCSAPARGRDGRSCFRGSVINRVIRDSGPIDVHVISSQEPPRRVSAARRRPSRGLTCAPPGRGVRCSAVDRPCRC